MKLIDREKSILMQCFNDDECFRVSRQDADVLVNIGAAIVVNKESGDYLSVTPAGRAALAQGGDDNG